MVGTDFLKESSPVGGGREWWLVTFRREQDQRVRIERDGDDCARLAGEFAGVGDEGCVPAVNAVEVADGHDSGADRPGRRLVEPEPNDRHASPALVQGI